MVLEQDILPYLQWLLGGSDVLGALPRFFLIVLGLGLLGLLGGYIMAAARHGLLRGGDITYRTVSAGFRELFEISPRRIWALARLAMKEAWRRRVWVALAIFVIILIFAGWFLKTDHQDPAKLYISFVLTATTYLVLGIALLLSAFSLPGDFKSKTIYTVVTKPVRSGEIVLGRILGFTLIGTLLLATMAVCSYVFVTRSLAHTHTVESSTVKKISGDEGASEGRTTRDGYHRHFIELGRSEQDDKALSNHGHYHPIEQRGDDYRVLQAENFMRARVPRWGKLEYLDRQGVSKKRGISVGSEWTYRSFIEGGSQASAIWTFDGVRPPSFLNDPEVEEKYKGLPIGLIVRVFRTHKGTIGKAIGGSIQVRNPETGLTSEIDYFRAVDAKVDEQIIPRKLTSTEEEKIDLYEDLVSNGKVQIVVQCMERGQYFGFAKPDCYMRLPDGSPVVNFIKVYLSIWVQMVIVIAIGVAASTLLSGPVAMLLTVSFILLGFFRDFFVGVATGQLGSGTTLYGGGPIESLIRILTQQNVMSPLKAGGAESAVQGADGVLRFLMQSIAQVLPDFSAFSTVDFAAYGYDVPADRVFQDLTTCLAYVVGLSVIGYFLLRTREVAR